MKLEKNNGLSIKKQFFIALFVLAPMSVVLAQAPHAAEDGTWLGTYNCSQGAPPFTTLKPFSFPMTFVVANRTATNRTDNADLREQMVLRFDGRGSSRVEVDGERKTNAHGTWSIKATGAVIDGRLKATGPMFRADGTTLVRAACSFDLTRLGGNGGNAPAQVAPAPVANAPERTPPGPTPQAAAKPLPSVTERPTAGGTKAPDVSNTTTADTANAPVPPLPPVATLAPIVPAPVVATPPPPPVAPAANMSKVTTAPPANSTPTDTATLPVSSQPAVATPAPAVAPPVGATPPVAAPVAQPLSELPAKATTAPPPHSAPTNTVTAPAASQPPVATLAPIVPAPVADAPPAVQPSTSPAANAAPGKPAPSTNVPPAPSNPPAPAAAVPDRAKAIKDGIDFLIAQDIARAGRQADGQEVAQATKVSLSVMDGLGSLGVSMFLDTRSPLFKRDLAGNGTLGDGSTPTNILLMDATTRIPGHKLSALAALSLEQATTASAARPDMNGYLLLLGEALGRALASKGIQAAPTAQDPKPKFSFTFAPLDWAKNRGEPIELIGAGRQFPLIIVYNAQIDPVQGNEVVLYEQSDRRYEVAKSHDAYMQMVQQVQARLNDAGLLRLATLSPADLAAARAEKLAAARVANDRAMQEMHDRMERINAAAKKHTELVGSLRIYHKGKPIAGKPENGLCTVKAEDGMMLRGLAAAPAFLEFAKVPAKSRFSLVADTPDELFAAVTADKCYIVVDYAENLQKYMAALGRDGISAYNVGPTADRGEAQEPFAVSVGYENWRDYQFADAIPGDATPGKVRELKSYKVMDEAGFKAVVARMRTEAYGDTDAPDVDDVLTYLADDAEGHKNGQSAKAYRQAENARRAAEQRAREQAASVQAAEKAKAFPYIAIFTCGMGNGHINILACFASQGSSRVDTELKLTNGDESEMFKAYTLRLAGKEQRDGFYIDLREHFSILAQNSHDSLILGLKVVDRVSGKVLYQNQAARFGVLRIAN